MNTTTKKLLIFFGVPAAAFCIIAVSFLIFMAHLLSTTDNRADKEEIFRYVTENQKAIEVSVLDFMSAPHEDIKNEIKELSIPFFGGIKSISLSEEKFGKQVITFYCGGYGIGSATGYTGFKYTLFDDAVIQNKTAGYADLSSLGYSGCKFIPRGNGWHWKEGDGDNTVYIENITGNFYYYREDY